jgi:hypothetical protein
MFFSSHATGRPHSPARDLRLARKTDLGRLEWRQSSSTLIHQPALSGRLLSITKLRKSSGFFYKPKSVQRSISKPPPKFFKDFGTSKKRFKLQGLYSAAVHSIYTATWSIKNAISFATYLFPPITIDRLLVQLL